MEEIFNIPNILVSLRHKLDNHKITKRDARVALYRAGWFNYVPSEYEAMRLLNKCT